MAQGTVQVDLRILRYDPERARRVTLLQAGEAAQAAPLVVDERLLVLVGEHPARDLVGAVVAGHHGDVLLAFHLVADDAAVMTLTVVVRPEFLAGPRVVSAQEAPRVG